MNIKFILIFICGVLLSGTFYYFITKSKTTTETPVSEQSQTTEPLTIINSQDKVSEKESNTNQIIDNKKIMNATLHTNKGDISITFNPNTPNTVQNFIKLAKEGYYDNTKFHRVIKGFMNQGGDPLSKDDALMARWGTGGPGYAFADEIYSDNHNLPGTIAMANSGPNTNGSQFFINAADNSFLDVKHTVFGMVTAGADVVMAINAVAVGANDRPIEPIIITSISLK